MAVSPVFPGAYGSLSIPAHRSGVLLWNYYCGGRGIIRWRLLGLSLGEGDNQVETVGGYHWVSGIIRRRLLGVIIG